MTTVARLSVSDGTGQQVVEVSKPIFTIGRRTSADLQLVSRDVSREHARITCEDGTYTIADCGSRFGTFVNDDALTAPRTLAHGDRIRLGKTDAVDLVFLTEEGTLSGLLSTGSDSSSLMQMAAVLNGLRALGEGRVLDEVLTLVLDGALDVTSAERGFIMLSASSGELEFRIGRAKGRRTLTGSSFATSHKIPREVFASGQSQIDNDLMAGDIARDTIHLGIRRVLCVPLKIFPPPLAATDGGGARVIGVLYLDARERALDRHASPLASLEAFATQAALAIESARLYAEAADRAQQEREWRLAAEIQRTLLPSPRWRGTTCDLAAASTPCRTIGGDFFDYFDLPDDGFGFALGDVAGKGPPAALLAATVQSNLAAHAPVAAHPADLMARLNRALLRRAVEARFATMFYGVVSRDGQLQYSNAGHEPPVVLRQNGDVEPLDIGGPVLGLLPDAAYDWGTVALRPGDIVVVSSDGVTEARNAADEEFGSRGIIAALTEQHARESSAVLERVLSAVRDFAGPVPAADDITAVVLRYRG